jgi:hypothetical protein
MLTLGGITFIEQQKTRKAISHAGFRILHQAF